MNALQVIQTDGETPVHSLTKVQREQIAATIIGLVRDGKMSALDVHQSVKALAKIFEQIGDDDEFRDLVLNEAAPYEKTFSMYGNTLEKSEAGVKYDYSLCGDPEYSKLFMDFKDAEKKLKQRQEYLKRIPKKGVEVVDEDTGEVYRIYPPSKTSESIIKVTLK